jgi:diphthamide synthase (EF-2-diphthine--ammonia ligase)
MTKSRVSISWSSGKDAALALHKVLEAGALEVVNLHTTISQGLKRVGMHGTPLALVEAQARAIGLGLEVIEIPPASTNETYETAMLSYYASLRERGIDGIVFGDIFLEDLRAYRDALLQRAGLRAYYPLWQQATGVLAAELQ